MEVIVPEEVEVIEVEVENDFFLSVNIHPHVENKAVSEGWPFLTPHPPPPSTQTGR